MGFLFLFFLPLPAPSADVGFFFSSSFLARPGGEEGAGSYVGGSAKQTVFKKLVRTLCAASREGYFPLFLPHTMSTFLLLILD